MQDYVTFWQQLKRRLVEKKKKKTGFLLNSIKIKKIILRLAIFLVVLSILTILYL